MAVITLSRQVGSRGDEIADKLCSRLDYRYLDKWLLTKVASEVGLSENEVVDFSEDHYKARTFIESLFGPRHRVVANVSTRQRDTEGRTQITVNELDEAQCINLVQTAVLAAHQQGNFVIAGRGGQAILHGRPDVLHVRIIAPLEQRVRQLRETEHLSEAEARSLIQERDRAAAEYLARFFDIQWDDPLLYHLVINTGDWDLEGVVDIISAAARQVYSERNPTQPIHVP